MLVIDSRERKGSLLVDLVEKKAKSMNIKTEKRWLEIGDYVFDDVCFEAKSVVDFINSVMSKRIWTQIDNIDRLNPRIKFVSKVIFVNSNPCNTDNIIQTSFNVKRYSVEIIK